MQKPAAFLGPCPETNSRVPATTAGTYDATGAGGGGNFNPSHSNRSTNTAILGLQSNVTGSVAATVARLLLCRSICPSASYYRPLGGDEVRMFEVLVNTHAVDGRNARRVRNAGLRLHPAKYAHALCSRIMLSRRNARRSAKLATPAASHRLVRTRERIVLSTDLDLPEGGERYVREPVLGREGGGASAFRRIIREARRRPHHGRLGAYGAAGALIVFEHSRCS